MNKKTRQLVYEKYNGHCAYCGKEIEYKDMQVDHFIPQRMDGSDDLENLMPSCRLCNHYKRANNIETFRHMIATIPQKLMRGVYTYKVAVSYGFATTEEQDIKFYYEKYKEIQASRLEIPYSKIPYDYV